VAKVGDIEKKAEVDVVEKDTKEVTINLPPPPPEGATSAKGKDGKPTDGTAGGGKKTSPLVYAGFGVAGAGLLIGGITGVLVLSKKSDLQSGCTNSQCPPSQYSKLDGANTMATISTIGFIAAGVGAAVGVVGLVISPKADKSETKAARGPSFVLSPSAMPGGGGLAASGSF
jgi:hypothetical protein